MERLLLKVSERKRSYEALQLDLRKAVRQVHSPPTLQLLQSIKALKLHSKFT
jgi:hypothetical protein